MGSSGAGLVEEVQPGFSACEAAIALMSRWRRMLGLHLTCDRLLQRLHHGQQVQPADFPDRAIMIVRAIGRTGS